MSIPDFLYTDIKSEERSYSQKPPGNFSVGQALKQRAPWARVKNETKRVQKSIVFADWTFEAWSPAKREIALQKILQFMKEGFSFYLWEYEEFTPLNEKKMLQMCMSGQKKQIPPTPPEVIAKVAAERFKLPEKQILVLDNYSLNHILKETQKSKSIPEQLFLSELSKLKNETFEGELLLLQASEGFSFYLWEYEEFTPLNEKKMLQMCMSGQKKQIPPTPPEVIAKVAAERFKLPEKQILVLDNYSLNHILKETQKSESIPEQLFLSELSKLKNETFERELLLLQASKGELPELIVDEYPLDWCTTGALKTIKEKFPNMRMRELYTELQVSLNDIKKLITESNDLIDGDYIFKQKYLESIEKLVIVGNRGEEAEIDLKTLNNLFLKMPDLKHLGLHDIAIKCEENANIDLIHLENIQFYNCKFNENFLDSLSSSSKKIKSFVLTNKKLSYKFLKIISDNMKNLKNLNLIDCEYSEINTNSPHDIKFNNLESIWLSHSSSSYNSNSRALYIDIFSNIKLLRKCGFSSIKPFDLHNIIKKEIFNNLHELSLDFNEIESNDLYEVINNCKNLETLRIHDSRLVNALQKNLDLYHLKKLDLYYLKTLESQGSSFYQLLNNAKNLEEISYNFSNRDLNIMQNLDFPKLKTFNACYGENYDNDVVIETIAKFPTLKNINFFSNSKSSNSLPQQRAQAKNISLKNAVDCDTTYNANKVHHTTQFFFPVHTGDLPPSVREYRLRPRNTLHVSEAPGSAPFAWENSGPLELHMEDDIKFSSNFDAEKITANDLNSDYFLGKYSLVLNSEWQPLPSLSSKELITNCIVAPNDTKIFFAYSERDNLYYVRSADDSENKIDLQYLLKIPKSAEPKLPKKVKKCAKYCSSFTSGALSKADGESTGKELLECLIAEKKGSCRHRVVAFKELMQRDYPEIPVRAINNDCHAFVEVQISGEWVSIDLGGYDAKLLVDGKPIVDREWGDGRLKSFPSKEQKVTSKALKSSESLNQAPLPSALDPIQAISLLAHLTLTRLWNALSLPSGGFISPKENTSDDKSPSSDDKSPSEKTVTSHHTPKQKVAKNYKQQLKTWKSKKNEGETIHDFCKNVANSQEKKQLLQIEGKGGVEAATLLLQREFQSHSRPVFYIDSPDDLVCATASLLRTADDTGLLSPGPSGPLYTFLNEFQGKKPSPVLLINYDRFDADDIVRFNSILDKKAKVDGVEIKKNTRVIGIIDPNKPSCYDGPDFYPRFDAIKKLTAAEPEFFTAVAPLPLVDQVDGERCIIQLYNAMDWEERLLGRWVCGKEGTHFIEGPLPNALASGKPIEIQNGLWENSAFQMFWKLALERGSINSFGKNIPVPKTLTLTRSSGYPWELFSQKVDFQRGLAAKAEVLNSNTINNFFQRYESDSKEETLRTSPGLLEMNKGRELHINLTAAMNEDLWALFLDHCNKYDIQIVAHVAPGVQVPKELEKGEAWQVQMKDEEPWQDNSSIADKTAALVSDDPDVAISSLQEQESWQVIDISECDASDLLVHDHGYFDAKKGLFYFKQTRRLLLQALEEKKNVILTGSFSQQLVDELAPFLLARQADPTAEGKLILLSKNKEAFNYISKNYCHTATVEGKCEKLFRSFQKQMNEKPDRDLLEHDLLDCNLLEREPLSQLKARVRYLKTHPGTETAATDQAWKGMREQLPGLQQSSYELSKSAQIADACDQERLTAVQAMLALSPYVFLSGITGVGKSTFVEEVLAKEPNVSFYFGESALKKWATDDSSGQKLLFIDEANLSARRWSEFEGLFQSPPGIVIEGIYYPLSDKHKVVFAGNPVAYGDERSLAPLFLRHGNAVAFDPLPAEFIYERILKPVFKGTCVEQDVESLSRPMLDIYLFLCQRSKDRVLISPRELQMMALQTICYAGRGGNPLEAAKRYAYEIGKNLVLEEDKLKFDMSFKPKNPLPSVDNGKMEIDREIEKEFLVTSSRKKAQQQLKDFLSLREFRRSDAASNDAQRYGGLGGMILEGEPGCGKSEMVTALLLEQGLQEGIDFYRMPVSLSSEEKKTLLLKAFEEGAIVIVDEINSAPMMERLMNGLLMGKTPEGGRPNKPGFLLIGTQNPVSMAGRRAPSAALARRMTTTVVPPYTREEMIEILRHKGLDKVQAESLVRDYLRYRTKAAKRKLMPPPTFRDLLKAAEQIVKE